MVHRLLTVFLVCAGVAGCASPRPDGPRQAEMEDLYRGALDPAFTPEREVIVTMVRIPPHTTLERHRHPGEEFHYYMEGAVTIAIDGMPPIEGRPGAVGHVPYRAAHTAITGEQGATILVLRVHTRGEPVRYAEDSPR